MNDQFARQGEEPHDLTGEQKCQPGGNKLSLSSFLHLQIKLRR